MPKAIRFVRDNATPAGDGKTPSLYLCPEAPYWFVPNTAGRRLLESSGNELDISPQGKDDLIRSWNRATGKPLLQSSLEIEHFYRSFDLPIPGDYAGRAGVELSSLSELWLHITDSCNLRCKHCLFGANFSKKRELPREKIKQVVREAVDLGCGLLCFTGGEPFLYPDFTELLDWLHTFEHLQVAILTNGILIEEHLAALTQLDRQRIHFQISLEGPKEQNDAIRGRGSFAGATRSISLLRQNGFSVSIATTVESRNMTSLPQLFAILADLDVFSIHFQYHFQRGFGENMEVAIDDFRGKLPEIFSAANRHGITIDNVEAIRSQVFSPPGTRFDFGNGGWESLAVGPDGKVYPTPATIDIPQLNSGTLFSADLDEIWQHSEILQKIRNLSLLQIPEMAADPFRFLIGGGDLDHCLTTEPESGLSLRLDLYAPIARDIARYLILSEAAVLPDTRHPGLLLRMGDVSTECPSGGEVNFTHCNCLLSLGGGTHGLVRNFYGARAEAPDQTILNPVLYAEEDIEMVPKEARGRMYGCGSPVDDAEVKTGETVVDLGSGTGVECFLAARKVGKTGKVFGIDMTRRMLAIADKANDSVALSLGYRNVEFKKGLLEEIPLNDSEADVVISNCVVNLSENKRRVFQEILRILKPGGRLVISDVVTESEPPPAIRSDKQLSGECIGGAMVQEYLLAVLRDMGFEHIRIVKRFPYRTIQDHRFYSLTYSAFKPEKATKKQQEKNILYTGPFATIALGNGEVVALGQPTKMRIETGFDDDGLSEIGMLTLDHTGAATNIDAVCGCDCGLPPVPEKVEKFEGCGCEQPPVAAHTGEKPPLTGCLICGRILQYLQVAEEKKCAKCGREAVANAMCLNGHFICDNCHIQDPLEIIKKMCLSATETDMISLLQQIRETDPFPMHGPEHHILVPAVILSTYRNLNGDIGDEQILQGIERGSMVPGGSCGFMGICGAASGAGIAFSVLLESSPLTPSPRQKVQQLVADILNEISNHRAARCCQRECYIALAKVAEISRELLPVALQAEVKPVCTQFHHNRECIRTACQFYRGEKNVFPEGSKIAFPMANMN